MLFWVGFCCLVLWEFFWCSSGTVLFVFWVVLLFLVVDSGCVSVWLGALSMLLKATFNVAKKWTLSVGCFTVVVVNASLWRTVKECFELLSTVDAGDWFFFWWTYKQLVSEVVEFQNQSFVNLKGRNGNCWCSVSGLWSRQRVFESLRGYYDPKLGRRSNSLVNDIMLEVGFGLSANWRHHRNPLFPTHHTVRSLKRAPFFSTIIQSYLTNTPSLLLSKLSTNGGIWTRPISSSSFL